jgi:hypothetical protein
MPVHHEYPLCCPQSKEHTSLPGMGKVRRPEKALDSNWYLINLVGHTPFPIQLSL